MELMLQYSRFASQLLSPQHHLLFCVKRKNITTTYHFYDIIIISHKNCSYAKSIFLDYPYHFAQLTNLQCMQYMDIAIYDQEVEVRGPDTHLLLPYLSTRRAFMYLLDFTTPFSRKRTNRHIELENTQTSKFAAIEKTHVPFQYNLEDTMEEMTQEP